MRSSFLFAVLTALAIAPCADAQQNRRDRQDPELVIESGGRMGMEDKLGRFLQRDQKVPVGGKSLDLIKDKELPAVNEQVLKFAEASLGKQVGNGECWTLADQALASAKAKRPINFTARARREAALLRTTHTVIAA